MASSSASQGFTSMEPDAPATKRDLNEMAEAIMEDVGRRFDEVNGRFDEVNGRFDGVNGRFDEVNGRMNAVDGRFDKLETLLRLVAVRVGITEPEIEEALQ